MLGGVIVRDGSLSLVAKLVWAAKKEGLSFYYFPLICPPVVRACGNEMDQKKKVIWESMRHQSSWSEMEAQNPAP